MRILRLQVQVLLESQEMKTLFIAESMSDTEIISNWFDKTDMLPSTLKGQILFLKKFLKIILKHAHGTTIKDQELKVLLVALIQHIPIKDNALVV